jgi:5'-nucleotidase
VRILVTNDDGVHAPGLAALTRAAHTWTNNDAAAKHHEIVVVAPLSNHSGASAAVGSVFERERIPYRAVQVSGAREVPAFGVDASPALSVIVAALGAFGPRPDLVLSGINLGVNVGRSVLHSGTVGAALTAAQFGISGLAVSMRSDAEPLPWATAATLAMTLVPELLGAPPGTVLNLNTPSVPLDELQGVRRGHIGSAGVIKSASDPERDQATETHVPRAATTSGPELVQTVSPQTNAPRVQRYAQGDDGHLLLHLGSAIPSLGATHDADPTDDTALVAAGFASLTPLVGIREDMTPRGHDLIQSALAQLRVVLEDQDDPGKSEKQSFC